MFLTQQDNNLILTEVTNFDPFVSLECGQCFRFERLGEEKYSLVACGRRLFINKIENGWMFENTAKEEFCQKFLPYFDLERDYGAIIKGFPADEFILRSTEYGKGIRIFRQDPWETIVSFIISQNNNIPRIKKIIEALCQLLGEENEGVYSFPTAERIAKAGKEGLASIKCGFRDKYIIDAAEKVALGEINLEYISKCGYETALAELKKIKGIGDKVANCVLLFGFGYYNAFPIDVWMKRIIDKYYGGDFDPTAYGEYAGMAQQYMFFYERSLSEENN